MFFRVKKLQFSDDYSVFRDRGDYCDNSSAHMTPEDTEEVRFELTKRFHVYTLSKRAPSATRTLLQWNRG